MVDARVNTPPDAAPEVILPFRQQELHVILKLVQGEGEEVQRL
jgi:hypothetical protein